MAERESFESQLRRLEVELAELDQVIALTQARGDAMKQRRSATRLAAASRVDAPADEHDAPATRREVPRPTLPPESPPQRRAQDDGSGRYTILNEPRVRRPLSG